MQCDDWGGLEVNPRPKLKGYKNNNQQVQNNNDNRQSSVESRQSRDTRPDRNNEVDRFDNQQYEERNHQNRGGDNRRNDYRNQNNNRGHNNRNNRNRDRYDPTNDYRNNNNDDDNRTQIYNNNRGSNNYDHDNYNTHRRNQNDDFDDRGNQRKNNNYNNRNYNDRNQYDEDYDRQSNSNSNRGQYNNNDRGQYNNNDRGQYNNNDRGQYNNRDRDQRGGNNSRGYEDRGQNQNREPYQQYNDNRGQQSNRNQQQNHDDFYDDNQDVGDEIITVSHIAGETCRRSQLKQMQEFLDMCFGYGDIEIRLMNGKQQIIEDVWKRRINFAEINLDISKGSQIQSGKSSQVVFKLDREDERNNYLFQVKEQENNVTAELKMIMMHQLLLPQFIRDSEQQKLQIKVSGSQHQYKLIGNNPNTLDSFFKLFSKTLDKTVLLLYTCNSNSEAEIKNKLLQPEAMQIAGHLKCTDVRIESFLNINQQFFEAAKNLIDSVNFYQNQPTICALVSNNLDLNIKKLENQFIQIVDKLITVIKDDQTLEASQQPRIDVIENKIKSIPFSHCVLIGPNFNYQTKKYVIEIKYMIWKTQQSQKVDMIKIKEEVYKIFNPALSIPLTNTSKAIWYDMVSLKVTSQSIQGKVSIKTIHDEIQITGDQSLTQVYYDKITQMMAQYKYSYIECKLKDKKILKILSQQPLETILRKDLEIIEEALEAKILIDKIEFQQESIFFRCIYKVDGPSEADLRENLKQEFIHQIKIYPVENLKQIIEYMNSDDEQFEQEYCCVITSGDKKNDYPHIICTKERYKTIEQLIEDYDQAHQVQYIDVKITQNNLLILRQVEKQMQEKSIVLGYNLKWKINNNTIILSGPEDEVQSAEKEIQQSFTNLQAKYVKQQIDLNNKEITYFSKKLQQQKVEIEKKEDCIITVQSNSHAQSQILLTIRFQNKSFNIVYGDISKYNTDAIVNSCNQQLQFGDPNMLTGVAHKIFQLGDHQYQKACTDYIQRHKKLNYGTVLAHHHNDQQLKYILSIATPVYQQGKQTDKDLQIIVENIKAIFQKADQLKLREITLPIFGGGASGYSFSSSAQIVLNTTIECLYTMNTSVQNINIIEIDSQKLEKLIDITNSLVKGNQSRAIKYQWQWFDQAFKDYDDDEVNEQIDKAYEEFLKNKQKNELKLIFPFSKLPGTHIVDLIAKTLTDKDLKTTQPIQKAQHQGVQKYHFNGQPVHDVLNEFMFLQEQSGKHQFEIFFKRHKIIFASDKIQQINEETNYARPVQAVAYQKPQQKDKGNFLRGKQYQLQSFQFNKSMVPKDSLTVEVINMTQFQIISDQIKQLISSKLETLQIKIPYLKEFDLKQLVGFIEQKSVETQGQIKANKKVSITVFKDKTKKILQHMQFIQERSPQYPEEWDEQQQNSVKFDLPTHHPEYQKIKAHFLATNPTGVIHKIFRIQNQMLWDNYIIEKKKLLERMSNNNIQLQQKEIETYLWHGTRNEHPKVIYSKDKEAFDVTFSNVGMWGPGAYFAEQARYSRDYSHTLTAADDPVHAGKLVFLCCLLTTGKVHNCNPDNTLRRPPDGSDCVSGLTNGSQVYILYQMDVRRAYPAYEVIYQ